MKWQTLALWFVACVGAMPAGCGFITITSDTDYKGDLFEFTNDQADPILEATAGARATVLGDIDRDGYTDVASISGESQPVQLHLWNAATGVFDFVSIAGGAPLSLMSDIEIADLNGDGRLDLIVLVEDTGYVPPTDTDLPGALVLLLQGSNPRDPATWTQVDFMRQVDPSINCFATPFIPECNMLFGNSDTGVTDMAVGDVTGDGRPDIVVLSNEPSSDDGSASTFCYLFANPGPTLVADPAAWQRVAVERDVVELHRVKLVDLDVDGDLDVVITAPEAKSFNVRWMRNLGAGATWRRALIGQQQGGAEQIAIGDIDGDGDPDVASCSVQYGLTQWFRNPGPANVSAGSPQIPWDVFNIGNLDNLTINGAAAGTDINQVQLVDLDGNGTLDAFVTASGTAFIYYRNADVLDTWRVIPTFTTEPTGTIGKSSFLDVFSDGVIDVIAPIDREGLNADQLALFNRR